MATWQNSFEKKTLSSAEKLVSLLPSSGRIVLGHAAGEPGLLVDALVEGSKKFQNLEIMHMVPLGAGKYCEPGYAAHFRHNALFVGQPTRAAVNRGQADYTPVFFSEIPKHFRNKTWPVDAALITVSPPDEDGWMSYGVSVDYTEAAATSAKLVIAEVNSMMPFTFGSKIHVSQIDHFVRSERPLFQSLSHPIGKIESDIGRHCAKLVSDGACLQLGIGSIPDAVLASLQDKNDLGIHTEMFSDGVVELFRRGNITGARKGIDKGLMVATFLIGSSKLYAFANRNEKVLMRPADYTNSPHIAAQNENLISINSAIQVDLYGQVCADMIGASQFSSVGGQVDFVRAASLSRGGRSIIALPSTAKEDMISRIVPQLSPGAAVTTSRFDVDTIVTEYGVAELRGKTAWQRREALIAIAHPKFRDTLTEHSSVKG